MKVLHIFLVMLSVIPWVFSMFFMFLTIVFSIFIEKLFPNSNAGNCWSHALPRWTKDGGYLAIRPAAGQTFLKYFFIPHVIWVKHLHPESIVEQLVPTKRKNNKWFPYYVFYFKGTIKTTEKSTDATNS